MKITGTNQHDGGYYPFDVTSGKAYGITFSYSQGVLGSAQNRTAFVYDWSSGTQGVLLTSINLYGDGVYRLDIPESMIANKTKLAIVLPLGGQNGEDVHCLLNDFQLVEDNKGKYLAADVMSVSDYYPYGFEMPDRSLNATDYRYGFNGMEKDDELKSSGNSYDFGARLYDSRLGRWMSVDPYDFVYPMYSPYSFAGNSPIKLIDIDGNKIYVTIPSTGESVEFIPGNSDHKDPFVASTFAALNELMKIEDKGNFEYKIITYMATNEDGVNSVVTKIGSEEHPMNMGTAGWNPTQATYVKIERTGEIKGQRPILTLVHEVAHDYEQRMDLVHKSPRTMQEETEYYLSPLYEVDKEVAKKLHYDSPSEFFPINDGETPYTKYLGDPVREDHSTYGFYEVSDYMSTTPLNDELLRTPHTHGDFKTEPPTKFGIKSYATFL